MLPAICLDQDTFLAPSTDPSNRPTTAPNRRTPAPASHVNVASANVDRGSIGTKPVPAPFVLASDETLLPPEKPGRPPGAFSSSKYPVIAVKARILLEAYMSLYARDVGTPTGSFGMTVYARANITTVEPPC
ncbi:hypothetical protein SEUCBS139899_003717 [Sporothrix eucalyptigena]